MRNIKFVLAILAIASVVGMSSFTKKATLAKDWGKISIVSNSPTTGRSTIILSDKGLLSVDDYACDPNHTGEKCLVNNLDIAAEFTTEANVTSGLGAQGDQTSFDISSTTGANTDMSLYLSKEANSDQRFIYVP